MNGRASTSSSLLALASFVVVVAGARVASDILVPVILAAFIAVLATPLLRWFVSRGAPFIFAFLAVFGVILAIASGIGFLLGDSIADFSGRVPELERQLEAKFEDVFALVDRLGLSVRGTDLLASVDAQSLMRLLGVTLTALGNVVSNVLFVIIALGFMLGEAVGLPRKLRLAFDLSPASSLGGDQVVADIQRYLWVKSKVSLLTGLTAWGLLLAFDVDYPFLWALLAFLLNYIPQIGSLIASIPPVLLAWVQFDGARSLGLGAALLVMNGLYGTVLEPRWMGKTFGISALVVFLSLLFWGWVWGPVGMLLAVPLTMIVKILLSHDEKTRWISLLLGSGKELRDLEASGTWRAAHSSAGMKERDL